MPQAYRLDTNKTWTDTYSELGSSFARWAGHLHGRINWSVEHFRRKSEVVLRYTLPDQGEVELKMDRQRNAESNLRVLYLAIEAMRMNDVRGVTDLVRQAYLALPAPKVTRDPYEVLGVRPDTEPDVIEAAYKAKAKRLHPDVGGDAEAMAELNTAYEEIRARSVPNG